MNSHLQKLLSLGKYPANSQFISGVMTLVKRGVFMVSASAAIFTISHPAIAASRTETLQAIHWVENPSDSVRPGPCGELGAYQFRAATWQMHSQLPFAEAIDRQTSDEVAVRHYEWLKTTLTRAGVEASTYNIALAWNAGVNAVIRGRIPAASRDYATRVNNLAADLSTQVAMK
jgi:hypothetical protein